MWFRIQPLHIPGKTFVTPESSGTTEARFPVPQGPGLLKQHNSHRGPLNATVQLAVSRTQFAATDHIAQGRPELLDYASA